MRVKLQLVLCSDEGHEETVTDIVSLKKDCHRLEHLGLTLAESKQLLKRIQKKLLQQQIDRYLKIRSQCPDYGAPLKAKNYTNHSFRTLFGTFKLPSPRLRHCTVAERLEAELGEEQWSFIDGCPRDWAKLPIPDGPITVGIDGGYVRSWEAKKKQRCSCLIECEETQLIRVFRTHRLRPYLRAGGTGAGDGGMSESRDWSSPYTVDA